MPDAINIAQYNAIHWVSNDGNKMMIDGVFDKKGTIWKKRGFSFITRADKKWSNPEKIKIKGYDNKNDGSISSVWLSPDESVMILSFSTIHGSSEADLFVSEKKNNKYSRPKKIKALSSKQDEHTPFVSNDGEKIFFSSNREGNYDIYIADRTGSGWQDWSIPQKLENNVNTNGMEAYYKIYKEGDLALFTSTTNSKGGSDIFIFEPEEEVLPILVNGYIMDDATGQAMRTGDFDLLLNGEAINSTISYPDSAAFQFETMPAEKILLTANVPGFTVDTVYIDQSGAPQDSVVLSAVKQKTEEATPVEVKTKDPVTVFGKILDIDTGMPIDPSIKPEVMIDSVRVYALNYQSETGVFSFSINPEGVTLVTVAAPGYLPQTKGITPPDTVDQYSVNFKLSKVKNGVTIQGTIMNRKTGTPIESVEGIAITVNNEVRDNVRIDPINKTYSMRIEGDEIYSISANKPGFFGVSENLDLTNDDRKTISYDIIMAPVEAGQKVKLNNILFETGRATLKDESIPELNRVVDFMWENRNVIIEISGHTDNVGSDTYNKKLSEDRAKSVARYIILKGIPRERIEFKGMGEEEPIASNETSQGRQKNRRVEFEILSN